MKVPLLIKILATAVFLLTIGLLSIGPCGNCGPPPIVTIDILIGGHNDSLTVEQGEPIWLYGSAMGMVPLTYEWYIGSEMIYDGYLLGGVHKDYSIDVPGVYVLTLAVTDALGQVGYDSVIATVLPAPPTTGDICGTVSLDNGDPAAGVAVTAVDVANEPVGGAQVTDSDGAFSFTDLQAGSYSVSIMVPLGYEASPSETQTDIAADIPCTEISFVLTPVTLTNNCRSMGYWKHQFDVYINGRGTAQETSADLEMYLSQVYDHFDVLGVYQDLQNCTFQIAQEILTVRGNWPMASRARQQLFALLLNFASGRIGNATIVSDDGRDAADAVTYVNTLLNDDDASNDELAKDICEMINQGELLAAGMVPASDVVYRMAPGGPLPAAFELNQNSPNPFNPSTEICFSVTEQSHIVLEVFNLLGQRVAVLADGRYAPGSYSVTWDASDQVSGVYLYRLTTESGVLSKKMVLLK